MWHDDSHTIPTDVGLITDVFTNVPEQNSPIPIDVKLLVLPNVVILVTPVIMLCVMLAFMLLILQADELLAPQTNDTGH